MDALKKMESIHNSMEHAGLVPTLDATFMKKGSVASHFNISMADFFCPYLGGNLGLTGNLGFGVSGAGLGVSVGFVFSNGLSVLVVFSFSVLLSMEGGCGNCRGNVLGGDLIPPFIFPFLRSRSCDVFPGTGGKFLCLGGGITTSVDILRKG